MLGKSEDWLRHARSDKPQWNAPSHQKVGRAVEYDLGVVLEHARKNKIQLPYLRGDVYGHKAEQQCCAEL